MPLRRVRFPPEQGAPIGHRGDMTLTNQTTQTVTTHPIDPARLDAVRRAGEDGWGNVFTPFAASGDGEPLRCCLRFAQAGEQIALISFAPFEQASPWR